MDGLHRGGAGFDHLDGSVELVQVRVDGPNADAVQAPHFQRQVRRAHLEGREPYVEMVIDQPGHDDVVAVADNLGVRILGAQLPVVAHRLDHPVPLGHRPISDNLCRVGAGDLANDVFTPYQR